MLNAECPECGGTITFQSSPLLQELVKCAGCGKDLQVTSLDPVELAAAEQEAEWGQ
ncbi:MAG: lysine biosynthesis protein LysW [Actinobacteria bacterium]|jgi:alpha-aminoadipate carrier protein LysW|nr:lysine biosynthesis protein LysW [Actinomycetota bacterium]